MLWLVVLPYRLSKGIVHKLGYHAYCGNWCETAQEGAAVRARLNEQFKAGMRQGMRGATSFGADQSRKMLEDMSLLPSWNPTSDNVLEVKKKSDLLRFQLDAADDLTDSTMALAVALGFALRQAQDPSAFSIRCTPSSFSSRGWTINRYPPGSLTRATAPSLARCSVRSTRRITRPERNCVESGSPLCAPQVACLRNDVGRQSAARVSRRRLGVDHRGRVAGAARVDLGRHVA